MNPKIIQLCKFSIQGNEGYRESKYLCSKKFWTIGFGHNLDASGLGYTNINYGIAKTLFENDFKDHVELSEKIPEYSALDDIRKVVLIEMVYQMGLGSEKGKKGIMGFTDTRRLLEKGDYLHASHEMLNSHWARNDSPTRAKRLSRVMRNGYIGDYIKGILPISGFTKEQQQKRYEEINQLLLA